MLKVNNWKLKHHENIYFNVYYSDPEQSSVKTQDN